MRIYLDRDQCNTFGVAYFDAASTLIAADAVLRSKDYDQEHRDFLEPLGSSTLRVTRKEADPPGWYEAS